LTFGYLIGYFAKYNEVFTLAPCIDKSRKVKKKCSNFCTKLVTKVIVSKICGGAILSKKTAPCHYMRSTFGGREVAFI